MNKLMNKIKKKYKNETLQFSLTLIKTLADKTLKMKLIYFKWTQWRRENRRLTCDFE